MPWRPLNNNSSMGEDSPRSPDPSQAKNGSQHWLCPGVCSQCLSIWGFSGGSAGKEPACQCRRHRRHGFDPWVGKIPWSRKWQPAPVFLPGKSHGQRSQAGYSPWGCRESDTTEQLNNNNKGYGCCLLSDEVHRCYLPPQRGPLQKQQLGHLLKQLQ